MKIDFIGLITSALKTLFSMFMSLLGPVLLIIFSIFVLFCVIFLYHYVYFRFYKKIKPIKKEVIKRDEPNIFVKLFWLFPRMIAYDSLTMDPNEFQEFGIHMICGEQGSGKTFTAVYLLQKWLKIYPKMQFYSNIDVKGQNGKLERWQDIILQNNGKYGVANFIDELPTWLYSSSESKDVPPELLGEISQQRKQKKAIIGTAQVFGKVAKPLREQTHFVYRPYTILNALTIVFTTKACYYDDVHDRWRKKNGFFIIVHTKELRESYDTFEKVQKYATTNFATSTLISDSRCALAHENTDE